MSWPPITFDGAATISPLLSGSSKARMSCMADVDLDHMRVGSRKNAITVTPLEGARAVAKVRVSEPTIYAGPFFLHFGHFISESLHRLWPRLTIPEWKGAKVAYHAFSADPLPAFITDALALYGVGADDLIPIRATTRFDRLCIAPQVRQMMGPTRAPEYRALLDPELDERFPASKTGRRLYVSRLHHHHTGSYLGESYVEAALTAEGFDVVYPERHPLHEMVALFRSADLAAFAEGSAMHIMELCGSRAPDTFVIARRPAAHARFDHLLADVCDRAMISDHILSSHGVTDDPGKHSGLLDLPMVLKDLWAFAGLPETSHRSDDIRRGVEHDARNLGLSVEVVNLLDGDPAIGQVDTQRAA